MIKQLSTQSQPFVEERLPFAAIRLSKEHNYWLNNLRNDLKAGSEIKNFIESYSKNKNSKLY